MTKKEQHPGGVKLTAKTARTLAMQEFGTARGLTKSTSFVGVYFMEFGNLRTDPTTGKTIEYTYTPRNADKDGQVLEVNEKVSNREEARQLAMKRLRQKNKGEFKASFKLTGDARLVAGITVQVSGYGAFDGKYIIETATHSVSKSGYKTDLTLRRVLEGY